MVYFILSLLMFSTIEIVSKPVVVYIDPFELTFYRFFLGFLVLFIFFIISGKYKEITGINKKDWAVMIFMGVINVFFSLSMLQIAVAKTNAATAATVFCSTPIFMLILAVILKQEKFSLKTMTAIIIGITGIFFIMWRHGIVFDPGALYALLAAIGFAVFTVLGKKTVAKYSHNTVNVVAFFFGLIAIGLYIIFYNGGFHPELILYNYPDILIAILHLGIAVSGFGYIFYLKTLEKLKASSASFIFILKPFVATFFAIIFLGENIDFRFWIGLSLIVAGSFLKVVKPATYLIKKYYG